MDEREGIYGTVLYWDEMSESGEVQAEDGLCYDFDSSSCEIKCELEDDCEVLFSLSENDEVLSISAA